MSDPIRYAMSWGTDEDEFVYVSPVEQPNGNWVKFEDYARLKAEVARLEAFCTLTIIPNEILQAENERLRKAGDAMLLALNKRDDIFDNSDKDNAIADWNAAKEGKPSV